MGMQTSIKEFETNAQSSMQKKQVSLLEPVLAKIQKSIDQVGAENGYTYIFSTHADYGGSAIILYAKNKEDNISDLVLKKLGVTPPVQGSASTALPPVKTEVKAAPSEPKPKTEVKKAAPTK